MQEMLGNQYFLARRYESAVDAFKRVLDKDRTNKPVRRKLIICYSQVGRIDLAVDVFISLIEDDVAFIINTDPVGEDCPCPELVSEFEAKLDKQYCGNDELVRLGMLWLYCDAKKSMEYFRDALNNEPENQKLMHIHHLLISHLSHSYTDDSVS